MQGPRNRSYSYYKQQVILYNKVLTPNGNPPPWVQIPKYVGWLTSLTEDNRIQNSIVSRDHVEYLSQLIKRDKS